MNCPLPAILLYHILLHRLWGVSACLSAPRLLGRTATQQQPLAHTQTQNTTQRLQICYTLLSRPFLPMSAELDAVLAANSLTAVVFFRGWWCPACREHLQQLDAALDDFAASSFGIIAVTSQPETDGSIALRLAERSTGLRFPVVSDEAEEIAGRILPPAAQFSLPTPEHLAARVKVDGKPFTPYSGLQPAIVVVDSSGVVRFVWSWDNLQPGALDLRSGAVPTKETMTRGAQGDPWVRREAASRPTTRSVVSLLCSAELTNYVCVCCVVGQLLRRAC